MCAQSRPPAPPEGNRGRAVVGAEGSAVLGRGGRHGRALGGGSEAPSPKTATAPQPKGANSHHALSHSVPRPRGARSPLRGLPRHFGARAGPGQRPHGSVRRGGSLSRTVACAARPRGPSAHDDAEAAVETVLPVVEEGAQSQGDGQGGQLLLQHPPDTPVTVQEPCRGGTG